jgi:hypothetical protein
VTSASNPAPARAMRFMRNSFSRTRGRNAWHQAIWLQARTRPSGRAPVSIVRNRAPGA